MRLVNGVQSRDMTVNYTRKCWDGKRKGNKKFFQSQWFSPQSIMATSLSPCYDKTGANHFLRKCTYVSIMNNCKIKRLWENRRFVMRTVPQDINIWAAVPPLLLTTISSLAQSGSLHYPRPISSILHQEATTLDKAECAELCVLPRWLSLSL